MLIGGLLRLWLAQDGFGEDATGSGYAMRSWLVGWVSQ